MSKITRRFFIGMVGQTAAALAVAGIVTSRIAKAYMPLNTNDPDAFNILYSIYGPYGSYGYGSYGNPNYGGYGDYGPNYGYGGYGDYGYGNLSQISRYHFVDVLDDADGSTWGVVERQGSTGEFILQIDPNFADSLTNSLRKK